MRNRDPVQFPAGVVALGVAVITALWTVWAADEALTAKTAVTAVLAGIVVAGVFFYLGRLYERHGPWNTKGPPKRAL